MVLGLRALGFGTQAVLKTEGLRGWDFGRLGFRHGCPESGVA